MAFHSCHSQSVTLTNLKATAVRNAVEYNHGLVFSAHPLRDGELFQVVIDRIDLEWMMGNIEIGVTSLDPATALIPVALRRLPQTWFMTGTSIMYEYGYVRRLFVRNTQWLLAGDRIGLKKTESGELIFYLNDECLGVAVYNMPSIVHAVVDMYGICVQISMDHRRMEGANKHLGLPAPTQKIPRPRNARGNCSRKAANANTASTSGTSKNTASGSFVRGPIKVVSIDRLRFHSHCGTLVKLSHNGRTAERRKPLNEFNNGVVMTHRYLYDDELFEIRIDRLVDKWSGSIEVGVTSHDPTVIELPATMTNLQSGTIMMSGWGILANGEGTQREYGQFNLDELREGDSIAMIRKWNGNLHYFINGLDQGVAATNLSQHVWGVIDLYGMTVKVTIIDRDEAEIRDMINPMQEITGSQELDTRSEVQESFIHVRGMACFIQDLALLGMEEVSATDRLLFHPICGAHAVVINNGLTAHRPRGTDDFNNGVVLTNRPLHPDELFEVRLERVVNKWAGSIEIGVTTHKPNELDFPFTMTNMESGTWMMTGNGVMHNRVTVLDRYGSSLDYLEVGDRVGVVRQSNGTLRFFVNGIDQGDATTGVPETVYGVIDLYGQAAQASIVQCIDSPESPQSSISNATLHGGELCFHRMHGRNIRLTADGMTAYRPSHSTKIDDGLLYSSRPLRECEMFQIRIDETLDIYSGSICIGVIACSPTEINTPSRFYEILEDMYILVGHHRLHNGRDTSLEPYNLNLDSLSVGNRIGIMRHADRSVHFYLDGMDQGKAWDVQPINIYAIVDTHGRFSKFSVSQPKARGFNGNSDNSLMVLTAGLQSSHATKHCFSEYCGRNIRISRDCTTARVISPIILSNLVFSGSLLRPDEVFEVEIIGYDTSLTGSLRFGVTDANILNAHVNRQLPNTIIGLPTFTTYIEGGWCYTNESPLISFCCPSLEWLKVKDRLGLRRIGYTDSVALLVNSEEIGVIFNINSGMVFAVFELCGPETALKVVSLERSSCEEAVMDASDDANSLHLMDSLDPLQSEEIENNIQGASLEKLLCKENTPHPTVMTVLANENRWFSCNYGSNVFIEQDGVTASRTASYNQGIIIIAQELLRGQTFQFKVNKLSTFWDSSLMVGVKKGSKVDVLPTSAADLRQGYWIVSMDRLYLDGITNWSDYGKQLDSLEAGSVISIMFTECGEVHLCIDGVNLGAFIKIFSKIHKLYPVLDLYGKCEQITILHKEDNCEVAPEPLPVETHQDEVKQAKTEINSDTANLKRLSYYNSNEKCGEKADKEYREKEVSSPQNNPVDPVSANEKINKIIQTLSLTISSTAANEAKNREIKQRSAQTNGSRHLLGLHPQVARSGGVFHHSYPNHFSKINLEKNNSSEDLSEDARLCRSLEYSSPVDLPLIPADYMVAGPSTTFQNMELVEHKAREKVVIGKLLSSQAAGSLYLPVKCKDPSSVPGEEIALAEGEDLPSDAPIIPVEEDEFSDAASDSSMDIPVESFSGVMVDPPQNPDQPIKMLLTLQKVFEDYNVPILNYTYILADEPMSDMIFASGPVNAKWTDKYNDTTDGTTIPNNNCPHVEETLKYKNVLGIPLHFFKDVPPKCHCDLCWIPITENDKMLIDWVEFPLEHPALAPPSWGIAYWWLRLGPMRAVLMSNMPAHEIEGPFIFSPQLERPYQMCTALLDLGTTPDTSINGAFALKVVMSPASLQGFIRDTNLNNFGEPGQHFWSTEGVNGCTVTSLMVRLL